MLLVALFLFLNACIVATSVFEFVDQLESGKNFKLKKETEAGTMGSVCCCLNADEFEDYVNPNSSVYRNCPCLSCFVQNVLNVVYLYYLKYSLFYPIIFLFREINLLPCIMCFLYNSEFICSPLDPIHYFGL